jgi:5-methylcytosine-specific restriction endonuclease McrA
MIGKQKVCVLDRHGKPLMPTSPRKARLFLKSGKAVIAERTPFTIQLRDGYNGYTQPVVLGVDAGYENVGYSAVSGKEELIGGELTLLKGMSERLKERAMYRRRRRGRLRHRKPRFDNRSKAEGWLAPSIQHKLDAHLRWIRKLKESLPIEKVIVEVANFDIQKIKDPEIEGVGYQNGEQAGYWNVREYILHRDGHACENSECKGKSEVLEVHHLGYWKGDRSDRPGNLITLCEKCHAPKNHLKGGFLYGWQPAVKSFKPETFMSMVRWRMVNELICTYTYGYLTKSNRIAQGLEKTHHNDAFVIAGGKTQARTKPLDLAQIRRNNRSLEKFYDAQYLDIRTGEKASGQTLSSGRRTRNKELSGENMRIYRGHKLAAGRKQIRRRRYTWQPGDLVRFEGRKFRVQGMQNKGAYVKLTELKKPVRAEKMETIRWRKGICEVWTTQEQIEASIC